MSDIVSADVDETKQMLINVENELARLSLTPASLEAQKAVKGCVYHIILRAIALSKDPAVPVAESKRLFEIAQEIIADAGLSSETDLKERLADLINAMVDQDDLAIQFRFYRLQNSEYFKTVFELIRNESALKSEEYDNLNENVKQVRAQVQKMTKKKNVLRVFLVSLLALGVLLFTIISSIVIILALLGGNNGGANTRFERSSSWAPPPVIYQIQEARE
jgi:hypothetical protein